MALLIAHSSNHCPRLVLVSRAGIATRLWRLAGVKSLNIYAFEFDTMQGSQPASAARAFLLSGLHHGEVTSSAASLRRREQRMASVRRRPAELPLRAKRTDHRR